MLALVAFMVATAARAVDSGMPESPCGELDTGYSIDDSVRGSLGTSPPISACVDVLRAPHGSRRRLRIFVGGKQVFGNDVIVLGPDDGGIQGDPFQPLTIKHGSLIVQNSGGGGRLRWSETWRLTIRNKQWVLAGWDEYGYDMYGGTASGAKESITSINALTGAIHDDGTDYPGDGEPNISTHYACKLPAKWVSPAASKIEEIRNRSFKCGKNIGKLIKIN
ncbi:hypothetical protein [Burkholderia paludis]|uniref:hypothetical protein n=1 Tax=Burkholderia paludis TaxID=1506587 RepID=UPI00126A274C|nr:hypothetical protein [Burkholderia paludis]